MLSSQNTTTPFTPYDNPLVDLEIPRSSSDAVLNQYLAQPGAYTAWIPATRLNTPIGYPVYGILENRNRWISKSRIGLWFSGNHPAHGVMI